MKDYEKLLQNKIVKAPEGLIEFFLPRYTEVYDLSSLQNRGKKVIYKGKPVPKKELSAYTDCFISLVGNPVDVDFMLHETWEPFIEGKGFSYERSLKEEYPVEGGDRSTERPGDAKKKKEKKQKKEKKKQTIKKTTKKEKERIKKLITSSDIIIAIKHRWITGSWPISITMSTTIESSVFKLFQSISFQTPEIMIAQFMSLLNQQQIPFSIIESSILRMIIRSQEDLSKMRIGKTYKSVLLSFKEKISNRNISLLVEDYLSRKRYIREDLSFIKFLLDIRSL